MKRFFLLFCFFALLVAVQATEYEITEMELTRLEKISENLEMNKRNQQLQVQSLKQRLTEALKKSESLRGQLQTERETLKSLRQSYAEYEKEVSNKIKEYEVLINTLKNKLYRVKLAIVIICCLFVFLILGNIMFLILKIKAVFF